MFFFPSILFQLYILPIHGPAEIEFYSFLFPFPLELSEVDLTCRPMTARRRKERRTDGRVERNRSKTAPAAPHCDSHQYNHLEGSYSRPGCFQWRDRIGTANYPDVPLAVLSSGHSMNPTAEWKIRLRSFFIVYGVNIKWSNQVVDSPHFTHYSHVIITCMVYKQGYLN